MRNKQIIIEIVVILLVILFLYTGISKLVDFKGFTSDLNNQPFPNSLTPVLSWALPIAEIAIVVALSFERNRLIGLYAALLLMSLFTMYNALVLLHVFDYVPCSCGGVISKLTWPQHLVFNIFFVIIIFIAIKKHKSTISYNIQ
ncbi:MauE/DoxX family redox-associated membrane protein [Pedobacter alluvionis]|uniref:Methylamine utilisation protein MauE domain-containing protein n=1 Tax=Pedobacter alluvionis TaxID=475253 RepID=A0A497Y3V7_9SPHI|nr:MauE/DoxX family redox-associated membrane protein [Pedobacter alluvionis]RLJ75147.1 hypothetical protein BCL90_3496 [Pedobacter alluvionis]TFB30250.1 hypothetical protein E3V97_18955 [Pedobacter alluvionis]